MRAFFAASRIYATKLYFTVAERSGVLSGLKTAQQIMEDVKLQEYKSRVSNILKVFRHKYGLRSDLVCVNSQTVGSDVYIMMNAILKEQNIAIEIDDRISVGKFMFINRELAASNVL